MAYKTVKITPPRARALETLCFDPDNRTWIMDLGIPRASVWKLVDVGLVDVDKECDALGTPGFWLRQHYRARPV